MDRKHAAVLLPESQSLCWRSWRQSSHHLSSPSLGSHPRSDARQESTSLSLSSLHSSWPSVQHGSPPWACKNSLKAVGTPLRAWVLGDWRCGPAPRRPILSLAPLGAAGPSHPQTGGGVCASALCPPTDGLQPPGGRRSAAALISSQQSSPRVTSSLTSSLSSASNPVFTGSCSKNVNLS